MSFCHSNILLAIKQIQLCLLLLVVNFVNIFKLRPFWCQVLEPDQKNFKLVIQNPKKFNLNYDWDIGIGRPAAIHAGCDNQINQSTSLKSPGTRYTVEQASEYIGTIMAGSLDQPTGLSRWWTNCLPQDNGIPVFVFVYPPQEIGTRKIFSLFGEAASLYGFLSAGLAIIYFAWHKHLWNGAARSARAQAYASRIFWDSRLQQGTLPHPAWYPISSRVRTSLFSLGRFTQQDTMP